MDINQAGHADLCTKLAYLEYVSGKIKKHGQGFPGHFHENLLGKLEGIIVQAVFLFRPETVRTDGVGGTLGQGDLSVVFETKLNILSGSIHDHGHNLPVRIKESGSLQFVER